MWLLCGLGNPGIRYSKTKHNTGFMVIDKLYSLDSVNDFFKLFLGGHYASYHLFDTKVHLLKPQTFMNNSGKSILQVSNFFKINNKNIIVIHDDLDLDFGVIKIKISGGHGGHNGLRDIINFLGRDFIRIRFGIANNGYKDNVVNYVLSNFNVDNEKILDKKLLLICYLIKSIIKNGLKYTQINFNVKNMEKWPSG